VEDPQTRLMHVEIDLENRTGELKAGMFGMVTIVLEKSDAFAVPSSCVVNRVESEDAASGNSKGWVYVVRHGRARHVPVELGSDNGQYCAVLGGRLRADDEVILDPPEGLADDTPVVVSNPETHATASR
jgi:multidrug efflux pump subunit AcrA (membrane-fusion protein)